MNAVLYFSCTGNSKKLAQRIAGMLNYPLIDIEDYENLTVFETVAIVFPVHCQGVPLPLKEKLKGVKAENFALIASYGGANAGNAVFEAAKMVKGNICAGAYIPMRHSYSLKTGDVNEEIAIPEQLILKILSPSPAVIKKRRKTPFAGFMPALRSRLGVKILKDNSVCDGCNACGQGCPAGAAVCGRTNSKCIRCLKCVYQCPKGALKFKKSFIMNSYLKRAKFNKTILYL